METIAIDIETVPLESALRVAYDPDAHSAPSNYKDPAKIAEWHERNKAKWNDERVKACSLNPRLGRIVAVGIAGGSFGAQSLTAHDEASEYALLADLWSALAGTDQLVTWNGLHFDLPFIACRSALLRVPNAGTIGPWMRRYTLTPHCDVKAMLCQWDAGRIREPDNGLDAWADAFGVGRKSANGSDVYTMHTEGRHGDIAGYAQADAALTLALYDRTRTYF